MHPTASNIKRWPPTAQHQRLVTSLLFAVVCVACEPRQSVDPNAKTHDITIGDAVLHMWGRDHYGPSVLDATPIDPWSDPRFHYPWPPYSVFLQVWSLDETSYLWTSKYSERLIGIEPNPALFAAPKGMTVYPGRDSSYVAIRLDETTFFDDIAYVECQIRPAPLPEHPGHECSVAAPITKRDTVRLLFNDDRMPPEQWRDLLMEIEAGLKALMSLKGS